MRLQESLREAQETLEAIRSGEVDAVVVHGPHGNQIYSLTGAEQPYRVYVERMQEGAVTISSDGLILYCNQRFSSMVCQPLEKVIGSDASAYFSRSAWRELYEVFDSKDEVVKCESELRRPADTPLSVNLTASHLPLEGQNVLCLVVTDLSSQKLQQEMQLAKEVAEKANLAKDAFLATLSHELRTPLNPALLLASEAAKNVELPASVRADMVTICNKIELEARLIDDLLDVTRISSGKLVLDLNVTDGRTILANAIDTVKAEIARKKIAFRLDMDHVPCLVKADGVRLQQAFWNILNNAVKFTPKNGEIKVRLRAIPAFQRLQLTVTDSGIGITAEELDQIFETFVQGDHARKIGHSQYGGLGLGLAISKKIIKLHSGDIRAQSSGRGKGSTFTIDLPLARQRTAGAQDTAAPARRKEHEPRKGFRILLVEDHEPTRVALTHLLSRRQHHVAAASTVTEAREMAQGGSFELLISDIGLPDGSGYDLMKEMKERYQLKGIALTGYGTEHDVLSSRRSGFFTHLTKPVRIESLEEAVAQSMNADA